jgi:osmotically-inducible protein OsmY
VVKSNFQRRRATRVLRFLTGVKTINNLLDLQEQPTPDDLNEQIRHTLDRRLSADTSRLQTSVEGNSVTVSGTVNSWTIRDQVEALILSLPGVVDVDNQLRVSHTTSV